MITQQKLKYRFEIKNILNNLKYRFSETKKGFYIPKEFSQKYFKFKKKMRLPLWLLNIRKDKLLLFLLELIKGDGTFSANESRFTFYQKNYQFISQIQEIAFKCGFSTRLHKDERPARSYKNNKINLKANTTYVLSCSKRNIKYGYTG
jgi:hypothetical protein